MNLYKEKIKQMILSIIAFSLILIGYLNYNVDNENLEISSRVNEVNLGDVELVNTEPIIENTLKNEIVSNDELNVQNIINESKIISEDIENYFEETRIERDRMYSEMLETYQKIVENEQTPSEQKSIAIQEISNLTKKKNGIMISENLIKNKGFENVVILENNGIVNVVVKSSDLNQEQISKIQNIIERELNVDVKNINISNK